MAETNREIDALAESVIAGDRRALARAITLVESARPTDRGPAEDLLARLLPRTGGSLRLGVSGAPGAGKSTFIERFGLHLVARGLNPAVLAVDPSSPVSGGSILGDKTRMTELARHVFVRPSPSGGALGGIARHTREAVLLCEAAGFDPVVIETVGVGQSEIAVAGVADMVLMLVSPGGGDELQGIKRGIIEVADLIVVTKADGELRAAAERTAADFTAALGLLRPSEPGWSVPVLASSALTGDGIDQVWSTIRRFKDRLQGAAAITARRTAQARAALWAEIEGELVSRLKADPKVAARLARTEAEVAEGRVTPAAAAREFLGRLLGHG